MFANCMYWHTRPSYRVKNNPWFQVVITTWNQGLFLCSPCIEGRDNVVIVATSYRLDGLELETRWVQGCPERPWGPQCEISPGVKMAGALPWPPSAEFKISRPTPLFPFCAFVACYRETFTFKKLYRLTDRNSAYYIQFKCVKPIYFA
jgi:hypothetical protein